MSRVKFLIAGVLGAAVLFAGAVSTLAQKPANKFADRGPRQERLRQYLGLTDEQVMQIQMIRREQAPKIREARATQRGARAALDEVIYADDFDPKAVETFLKAFIEAQAELTRLQLMNEIALRSVLTPEQLDRFREFRERQKRRSQRVRKRSDVRRERRDRPKRDTPR